MIKGQWQWALRRNRLKGICGTVRCALFKVDLITPRENMEPDPPSRHRHRWKPVPPMTFKCVGRFGCGEYRQFELSFAGDDSDDEEDEE